MKGVTVSGGTGFVGRRLELVEPTWFYFGASIWYCMRRDPRNDGLVDPESAFVHLAAKVGGIKDNSEKQAEYFDDNVRMNMDILEGCRDWGYKRVLSCLSTCAFPDKVSKYPFTEEDIFNGPPAETNFSYGYSKRMLHVQTLAYRKQYGLDWSTFTPCNLYGPGDHFGEEKSHFIAAMVDKFAKAKDGDTIEFWGDGKPVRQHLYVDDLASIIPLLLEHHHSELPLIVAPQESISIADTVKMTQELFNKDVKIVFNGELSGQYRKDGDNKRFIDLVGGFDYTPLKEGLKKTIEWYKENIE